MHLPTKRPDQVYPSDLSRQQFEVIRPLLESARKKTSPHKVDRFHIFNAVLYVLREGCRWRSLPKDYPDWNLCYYHYSVWRDHMKKGRMKKGRAIYRKFLTSVIDPLNFSK